MAGLRSLLAIYGALDEAIIRTRDPRVSATVDAYLPNASSNTGWYSEIETFFFGADARPEPDLNQALTEILTDSRGRSPLTAAQKSRLFFAVSAITRVWKVGGPTTFPSLAGRDPTQLSDSSPGETPFTNWLSYALAAVGPENVSEDDRRSQALSFLDAVSYRFPNRQSFYDFRVYAADNNWLVGEALSVPVCDTSIVTVDGIESVVIDTEARSYDVSLNQLKAIANPYNWSKNYPDFFCDMIPCQRPDRDDGWCRVLEEVGFCKDGGLKLRTMLKYFATEDLDNRPYEARLDYDLDEPKGHEGDGLVTVDRGFINMWSTVDDADANGVRVRTRKVLNIDGILPYAQARLVCITGYATASNEFLFGAASNPPPKPEKFTYYDRPVPPATEDDASAASAGGPGDAPKTTDHVGTTAVKVWTETAHDLTSTYFDLAGKWVAGTLQVDDVADYGKRVTNRLVKAPKEFLDAVSTPRYPGGGPGANEQDAAYSEDPSGALQQQQDMAKALFSQLRVIADEAAAEDKTGKWGLDGWVRTIHNLVDLQVRTFAAVLQTSVAGSWWKKLLGEPRPSEPVFVDSEPFVRNLQAGTVKRLALPKRTIPPSAIGFQPPYLPAGATQFQIYLKDYRYVGSNYIGTVVMTSKEGNSTYHKKIPVVVGL